MSLDRIDLALRLLAERDAAAADIERLGAREREALTLLVKGFDLDEIGDRMGLSAQSAKSNLSRAGQRLGLSRVELIVLATKAGMA